MPRIAIRSLHPREGALMRPPLRDEEAIVLPGNKRVSTKVKPVVMPTIEAWPTASKAPRPLEPANSSRLDVMPADVRKARACGMRLIRRRRRSPTNPRQPRSPRTTNRCRPRATSQRRWRRRLCRLRRRPTAHGRGSGSPRSPPGWQPTALGRGSGSPRSPLRWQPTALVHGSGSPRSPLRWQPTALVHGSGSPRSPRRWWYWPPPGGSTAARSPIKPR